MAKVRFENITKQFDPTSPPAVDNLNLEIYDKEFLVLVGPSGCGKTTSLRMLAGLETPTVGKVIIGDDDVTRLAPKDRDIAMVFQSYALYPHMTVRENLGFGLKNRELSAGEKLVANLSLIFLYLITILALWGISSIIGLILFSGASGIIFSSAIISFLLSLIIYPETRDIMRRWAFRIGALALPSLRDYLEKNIDINQRIEETAKILEIEELLDRKPKQLSGGQRQRVAVGRAIIRQPKVFLMDEPLSNLDAKLRNQTRAELASLQNRLEVTTLYVTHDQVEAMTLGHRIAVMNKGIIEQVGKPSEVYGHPRTSFVAGFIGSPSMNLLQGNLEELDGIFRVVSYEGNIINIPPGIPHEKELQKYIGQQVILGFRPEHTLITEKKEEIAMTGEITFSEAIGSITSIFVNYHGMEINVVRQGYHEYRMGENISFKLDANNVHVFDAKSTIRIEDVRA